MPRHRRRYAVGCVVLCGCAQLWSVPPAVAATPSDGHTFRIYATRVGLVGERTANGHVIGKRDHFVALPSRRGLAARDAGDRTVRVCTEDGARCEWAPVWDVGPWNVKDNYWDQGDDREMWSDLTHGLPQSQAAYEDGHNKGKDQFGRKVRNPAGIDLADGTIWDGLQLTGSSWVTVTFLWTGNGPWASVVTDETTVSVRREPAADAPEAGLAARYAQVPVTCAVAADGKSDSWFRLGEAQYVPADAVELPDTEPPPPCPGEDPG